MRVGITGASGFLGTAVAHDLVWHGHDSIREVIGALGAGDLITEGRVE